MTVPEISIYKTDAPFGGNDDNMDVIADKRPVAELLKQLMTAPS